MKLILASGSPRRSEILKTVGYDFCVRTADTDETLPPAILPKDAVETLARRKSFAVTSTNEEVILSADTVVALDGKILGKPKDAEEAFSMLRFLSGRMHEVYTGFVVRCGEKIKVQSVKTEVYFRDLSDDEIRKYIASGEPMDKAGAYGIQGKAAVFVEKINGDYLNVVGLPIAAVSSVLQEFNISI